MKKSLSITLLIALLLSLCSSAALASDPYAVTKPITIEFWHALSNNELLNQLIDKFEEDNPLITVNPVHQGDWTDINTKLSAAISSGADDMLPAVITLNPTYVGTFAEGGMVESLDAYVSNDAFPIQEFSKGMIDTFTYNGTCYGLPYLNSCLVMYYNADAVQAEQIDLPVSWTDMDAFVSKASVGDRKAIGFHAGGAWYYECFFTNRLPIFGTDDAPTCRLDDPLAIDVASDIQRWYAEKKADYFYGSSAAADGRSAFADGKLLCYMQSSAIYQTLKKMCNFEVGMTFPVGGERGRYSHVGGQGISLVARASQEQKNAGWQLIKYLTSPEVNLALAEVTGYLPTRTTTINSEVGQAYLANHPAFLPIIEMLDNIEYQPRYNNAVNCNNIWRAAMSQAIIEGGDMEKVMKNVTKQILEIIAEN